MITLEGHYLTELEFKIYVLNSLLDCLAIRHNKEVLFKDEIIGYVNMYYCKCSKDEVEKVLLTIENGEGGLILQKENGEIKFHPSKLSVIQEWIQKEQKKLKSLKFK